MIAVLVIVYSTYMKTLSLLFFAMTFLTITDIAAQDLSIVKGYYHFKYFNGDKRISRGELESIVIQDPEANELLQKSKRNTKLRWATIAATLGFVLWRVNTEEENHSLTFIGALSGMTAAIGFKYVSREWRKEAAEKYNVNAKAEVSSVHLGCCKNGLGLVVHF